MQDAIALAGAHQAGGDTDGGRIQQFVTDRRVCA
jgi:hypothetical protein